MSARYAQHFLINTHAAQRIVDSMNLVEGDRVLEIGPGKGALTALMMKKPITLTAIEIDDPLIPVLTRKFGTNPNFTLIHSDVLDVDFKKLSATKIIGNLPYNLTSLIFRKVSNWTGWTEAYFMIQKEVGDRLGASVGTADYGALTVGMSLTSRIERVFDLSETSFKPPPRVKSTVVRFIRREKPLTNDVDGTQKVIQAAFQQRRKTILNSLSHGLGLTKEKVGPVLEKLGIDVNARAENITIDQFVHLAKEL
jgi:16S rRNA (adenine1518-N6/adenine1519-N6)-dimethyltransferase